MLSALLTGSPVRYAFRFRDRLKLWQPPRPVVQELAFLSAARQRLIQAYNLLAAPLAEQESFVSPNRQKKLQRSTKKSLLALKADQQDIDQQMNKLIQRDSRLKEPPGRPRFRVDSVGARNWSCHSNRNYNYHRRAAPQ